MPKAAIGKTNWGKALTRVIDAMKHQLKPISQIRASVTQAIVENGENAEVVAYLLQINLFLDIVAEQNVEALDALLELWYIGTGKRLEEEDE
jgi:glycerol-3-phosphate dehydrogenase